MPYLQVWGEGGGGGGGGGGWSIKVERCYLGSQKGRKGKGGKGGGWLLVPSLIK